MKIPILNYHPKSPTVFGLNGMAISSIHSLILRSVLYKVRISAFKNIFKLKRKKMRSLRGKAPIRMRHINIIPSPLMGEGEDEGESPG